MPHGFKRDVTATRTAYRNGLLLDRDSFISLPDSQGRTHVRLEGEDRTRARQRAGALAKGLCAVCGEKVSPQTWELHHPGRCDCTDRKCPDHLEVRHSQWETNCHQHRRKGFKRHGVKFGPRRAEAVEEFNRVNP